MRYTNGIIGAALTLLAATATASPTMAASDRAITDALIWMGTTSRVARGRIDGRDRTAIRLAERRVGGYPDGRLDPGEVRAIVAVANDAREREGYRVVTDPATGARVGLPSAWLGRRAGTAEGSEWRSPDGAITVETFRRTGSLRGLKGAERARGVDVVYDAGRGSWRVVSGFAAGGRTVYTRAVERGREVSGFRVTYETALRQRLDRVAVAMSSDFRGFATAGSVDALAYAPSNDPRGADRFAPNGVEPDAPPRYAALPVEGPDPRERPAREVASLAPLDGGELDEPSVAPRREAPRRAPPTPPVAAPAEPGPPPVVRLDRGEIELAPSRGQDVPIPDTRQGEDAVPSTITGLITDEGQSCATLRGPDGTLYALVGEVPNLAPGTLVTVETIAVNSEACSAGRTVAVGGLTVRTSP